MHFSTSVAFIIVLGLSFEASTAQQWEGYQKPSRENIATERLEYNVGRLESSVNRLDSLLKNTEESRRKLPETESDIKLRECYVTNGLTQVPGYVRSPYGFHKLQLNPLNWNDARNACIRDGGHLAIINSEAEKKYLAHMVFLANHEIKKIIPEDWNGIAWVGVRNEDNNWRNVCDAPANEFWGSWNGARHPTFSQYHKCAALLHDYYNSYEYGFGMLSFNCNKKFVYICEIN